jgi:hypothetical protein
MRTSRSISIAFARAVDGLVAQDALDDLLADRVGRVQARHRLLEDHRHARAAQVAQRPGVELQQVDALEQDLAAGDAPRRLGDQAHDRERGDRLAAARLADDAERAPGPERERDPVDGAVGAAIAVEPGAQVADLQQGRHRRAAAASIAALMTSRSVVPA